METIVAFAILSIPLIFISWRTLLKIRSHGFYRFFSWECILWLTLSNYPFWFENPFGISQMVSWCFLFPSLFLVVAGVRNLKKSGKQAKERDSTMLYQFEKTTKLVDQGIFKYIRHPMYSSLLFLTWGIYFKHTTAIMLLPTVLSTGMLYLTALFDEKECVVFFGEKYSNYMKRTKMFIPFII